MKINTLVGKLYEANCYVLTFETFAIVIDPCVGYAQVKKVIGDLPIRAILLTHGHADHFSYLEDFKKHTNAKIYCHKQAREKVEDAKKNYSLMTGYALSYKFADEDYVYVHDGLVLDFEEIKIGVVATPGHSSCSVCFVIEENMFTGDMLFYRSIGRTDLYSANSFEMTQSIKKLKNIKENLLVYPGHGPTSFLHDEVKSNPYFKESR